MSNFFFSLNLRHIKKFVILFCYCPKYIGKRKEKREKERKNKSFKKMFIGLCRRKLNKEKLNQINSELAQI
jgi:Zn-finger protein